MKNLTLLFVFAAILISCEKEGSNTRSLIIENKDTPLISKWLIGGEVYMEYTYNQSNLVEEEKSKYHYTKHFYNESNQLVSSDFYWDISMASSNSAVLEAAMQRTEWVSPDNTPKSLSHELFYNGDGSLSKKSYIRSSNNGIDYTEFIYTNGKISIEQGYHNGVPAKHTHFVYDQQGNVEKKFVYLINNEGISVLVSTTEYEYDDMHNPFKVFNRLIEPGINTNPNNITKETCTLNIEVDPFTEKVQVTLNSYEYNDLGYPVKVNGITEYQY